MEGRSSTSSGQASEFLGKKCAVVGFVRGSVGTWYGRPMGRLPPDPDKYKSGEVIPNRTTLSTANERAMFSVVGSYVLYAARNKN